MQPGRRGRSPPRWTGATQAQLWSVYALQQRQDREAGGLPVESTGTARRGHDEAPEGSDKRTLPPIPAGR